MTVGFLRDATGEVCGPLAVALMLVASAPKNGVALSLSHSRISESALPCCSFALARTVALKLASIVFVFAQTWHVLADRFLVGIGRTAQQVICIYVAAFITKAGSARRQG
eukprot:2809472-Amphidinium_carterae.1